MWMPDACEPIDEQWPPFADAFREIHRFILKAKDGNAAAANALFQKYLNGELTDELLRISRCWVQEEQACAPNRSSEGAASRARLLCRGRRCNYALFGHVFRYPRLHDTHDHRRHCRRRCRT